MERGALCVKVSGLVLEDGGKSLKRLVEAEAVAGTGSAFFTSAFVISGAAPKGGKQFPSPGNLGVWADRYVELNGF